MVGDAALMFLTMFLAVWSSTGLVGLSAVLLDVPRQTAVVAVSVFLLGASVIMLPEMARIAGIIR